jgi:hypothetical protein
VFNALVEAATAGSPLHYVDLSGEFTFYSVQCGVICSDDDVRCNLHFMLSLTVFAFVRSRLNPN